MSEVFSIEALMESARDRTPEGRSRLFGLLGQLFLARGQGLREGEQRGFVELLEILHPFATVEARLRLDRWTRGLPGKFQLIGFIDVGEVDYAHRPWFPGPNHSRRSGIGAGVNWAGPGNILINATYAGKLGNEVATSGPDHSGRAWFQIVKLF